MERIFPSQQFGAGRGIDIKYLSISYILPTTIKNTSSEECAQLLLLIWFCTCVRHSNHAVLSSSVAQRNGKTLLAVSMKKVDLLLLSKLSPVF